MAWFVLARPFGNARVYLRSRKGLWCGLHNKRERRLCCVSSISQTGLYWGPRHAGRRKVSYGRFEPVVTTTYGFTGQNEWKRKASAFRILFGTNIPTDQGLGDNGEKVKGRLYLVVSGRIGGARPMLTFNKQLRQFLEWSSRLAGQPKQTLRSQMFRLLVEISAFWFTRSDRSRDGSWEAEEDPRQYVTFDGNDKP